MEELHNGRTGNGEIRYTGMITCARKVGCLCGVSRTELIQTDAFVHYMSVLFNKGGPIEMRALIFQDWTH